MLVKLGFPTQVYTVYSNDQMEMLCGKVIVFNGCR